MEKVSVETVKPWISQRINEILGFEDEVVIDFVFNMLETERVSIINLLSDRRQGSYQFWLSYQFFLCIVSSI